MNMNAFIQKLQFNSNCRYPGERRKFERFDKKSSQKVRDALVDAQISVKLQFFKYFPWYF